MKLVCGIKLTHDGGLALIDTTSGTARLLAAAETEKRANGLRHADLTNADLIVEALADEGLVPDDLGQIVVDGWGKSASSEGLVLSGQPGPRVVRTGPYRQSDDQTPPLHAYHPDTSLPLAGAEYRYASYRHIEGHLAGAYLTSPAAQEGRPAAVLVWDGGAFPELYLVDPDRARVSYLGPIFRIPGSIYSGFSCNVPPFLPDPGWDDRQHHDFHLTMPGKVMAYAGLGQVREEFVAEVIRQLARLDGCWDAPARAFPAVEAAASRLRLTGADILAGFQEAIARLLVEGLGRAVSSLRLPTGTLCFAGGSALNIKWNSAIRDSGLFGSVWVPPFPNDSGGAIGTACAHLMATGAFGGLDWSVYAGPALSASVPPAGWRPVPCSTDQLGALLHVTGKPVVVLGGRAELGPRALGHRSIMASPVLPSTKAALNKAKGREDYRPVAPICLEGRSEEIFLPGGRDPYMLFDHRVRPEWVQRIPAATHVDGTARLQTVNDQEAPLATAIVRAFCRRSSIPVLCNTSANHPGCGFFPDAASAMDWGGTDYVWVDETLFSRAGDIHPLAALEEMPEPGYDR
jgi:carbamoyltransferase